MPVCNRLARERVPPGQQQRPLAHEDESDLDDDGGGYQAYRQVLQNPKFDEYRLKAGIPSAMKIYTGYISWIGFPK
ncbi:hypothetical protein Dsin_008706 [Dipteronia sinensis]|uniref:Uncharacterized protein n=1 Tax=Dipteronia sinensis TaxID=43782 RepID=A0AAE0AP40_9ROSI|nr:hypothetical protein Dsin_008706 [Dipteronia sinensis]